MSLHPILPSARPDHGAEEFAAVLLSQMSGVSLRALRSGQVSRNAFTRLSAAARDLVALDQPIPSNPAEKVLTDMIDITPTPGDTVTAYSIAHGIDEAVFRSLTDEQMLEVARLAARAAERSYRRGFQQGATVARDRPADLPKDLHAWRYGTTTDLSPWADCDRGETSLSRLHTENDCLRRLGFPSSKLVDEYELFVWPPKALA